LLGQPLPVGCARWQAMRLPYKAQRKGVSLGISAVARSGRAIV
jgi:hypothetical protein